MHFVMDADCLIKLTKANLKEFVCTFYHVTLPETVRKEVIDNAEGHTDAIIIKTNIEKGLLNVDEHHSLTAKGEQSAISLYQKGGFDAVCSDDKRFIKKLKLLGIPYVTPAVFVALLLREGKLTISEAERKLDALSPFISSDEYLTVQLSMKDWRVQ
jgi:rRNA-processing protein FCF1